MWWLLGADRRGGGGKQSVMVLTPGQYVRQAHTFCHSDVCGDTRAGGVAGKRRESMFKCSWTVLPPHLPVACLNHHLAPKQATTPKHHHPPNPTLTPPNPQVDGQGLPLTHHHLTAVDQRNSITIVTL